MLFIKKAVTLWLCIFSIACLADAFVSEVYIGSNEQWTLKFGNARNEQWPMALPPSGSEKDVFFIVNQVITQGDSYRLGGDIRESADVWEINCATDETIRLKSENDGPSLPTLYYAYQKGKSVYSGEIKNNQLQVCGDTFLYISTSLEKAKSMIDIPEEQTVVCSLRTGWNMICPAVELDETSTASLLEFSPFMLNAKKIYGYASASELEATTVLWCHSQESRRVELSGTKVKGWELTVKKGWNLVGMVSEISSEERPDNIDSIWEWTEEGYVLVSTEAELLKGHGYWIYCR